MCWVLEAGGELMMECVDSGNGNSGNHDQKGNIQSILQLKTDTFLGILAKGMLDWGTGVEFANKTMTNYNYNLQPKPQL